MDGANSTWWLQKLGLSLQILVCLLRRNSRKSKTVKLLWNTNTPQPHVLVLVLLLLKIQGKVRLWNFYEIQTLSGHFSTQGTGFNTHMLSGQTKCSKIKKINLQCCSRCIFCERVKQNEIYACLNKVTQPRPRRRFYGTSKHCSNRQKLQIPKNLFYET